MTVVWFLSFFEFWMGGVFWEKLLILSEVEISFETGTVQCHLYLINCRLGWNLCYGYLKFLAIILWSFLVFSLQRYSVAIILNSEDLSRRLKRKNCETSINDKIREESWLTFPTLNSGTHNLAELEKISSKIGNKQETL